LSEAIGPAASQLVVLALAWALWAALHSLLLQDGLRARLQSVLGLRTAVYRLLYSVISLATILPVLMYYWSVDGGRTHLWPWPWLVIQLLLQAVGWGLMLWAWRSFSRNGLDLFGWGQARQAGEPQPVLVTSGAYARLRHPMNVAGLVIIWARPLGAADLVTNAVLTAYMILGSIHEERRLRRQFGQAYLDYVARVPVLPGLPW
jgi:protein-S-isoprenylcysteine O-methyltransferase Ste14